MSAASSLSKISLWEQKGQITISMNNLKKWLNYILGSGVKFIQRYLQGTCRLLTTEKFQTWTFKDLWPQVNRIRRSHYLQVTFVDLDPCPALNYSWPALPICLLAFPCKAPHTYRQFLEGISTTYNCPGWTFVIFCWWDLPALPNLWDQQRIPVS